MAYTDILIRLMLAAVTGGLIGYERKVKNRPAGFRTHILVCLGAALVMVIQEMMVNNLVEIARDTPELLQSFKVDLGRMGGQVVTGVGFLGAGTIITVKGSVKGLTTAASVWVVACIGIACGLGMYSVVATAVTLVLISLFILKKIG